MRTQHVINRDTSWINSVRCHDLPRSIKFNRWIKRRSNKILRRDRKIECEKILAEFGR